MIKTKQVQIIGGGIAGCALAYFLKNDFDVTLYEKKALLGGLCRTHINIEGFPYQKGIHIFHTNEKWIYDLVSSFIPLMNVEYKVGVNPLIDFKTYDYPLNSKTIHSMPWHWAESIQLDLTKTTGEHGKDLETLIINFYGENCYNMFYKNYLTKLFKKDPSKIDEVNWFRKNLRSISDSGSYFNNLYECFPINQGYNKLFTKLTNGVKTYFNSEVTYDDISGDGIIILTIDSSVFFNYKKKLQYRTMSFDIDSGSYVKDSYDTVIYPNHVPFISMNQFGKFFDTYNKNIIVKEYPDGEDKICPIPTKSNYKLLSKIKLDHPDIYFAGRIGSYQFLDMGDCVLQASRIAAEIKHKERSKR